MTELTSKMVNIVDGIGVGFILCRPTGMIIYANSKFEKISGYITDDIINMDIANILGADLFNVGNDGKLLCANHGAKFDPESGICIKGPCKKKFLTNFPFVIENNNLIAGN